VTDLQILQEARARRAAREAMARRARLERRRRLARRGMVMLGIALVVIAGVSLASGGGSSQHRQLLVAATPAGHPAQLTKPGYASESPAQPLAVKLKLPLRSGLLFDVRSGRVLWSRDPEHQLPIASLTKMMTALVVVEHATGRRVPITRDALHYSGSGVGLLPLHKRVPLETLLYGLLLPSGNDAAIALADYVAGSQNAFVRLMNDKARTMGLSCTHFATVSGILDQDNYSCAHDLAVIAHAVLKQRLLRRIVGSRGAVLPFPIKGGKLFLYNNNPLVRSGYPGIDGVKTGYTSLAGMCLVATARRGGTWLGVVLLHSGNWTDQAITLLNAGFAATGPAASPAPRHSVQSGPMLARATPGA
jgi:serine-type D-Ala-D-Ala carboxypeptidase (penicillin-binding protein 5/6)